MSLSAADQLAIVEVITRADEAASRRDADGYVALFTQDAVLDGTQGRHAGREALRAAVLRHSRGRTTTDGETAGDRHAGCHSLVTGCSMAVLRRTTARSCSLWPPQMP